MQKYEVTRTETVTVIARNEEHAEEVAIEEMQEHPNGDYEIKRLAPAVLASLHEVSVYLEGMGFHALYVGTPHHIDLQYLDIGTHQVEDMFGKIVPCSRFTLYGHSDDGSTWSGEGWFLETCEDEEIATFKNLNSLELAGRIAYQIGRADFDLERRGQNA